MLINLISGKSIVDATLLAFGSFGTVAATHMRSNHLKPETAAVKVGLGAHGKTTSTTWVSHGDSTSHSGQVSVGIPLGANLHGLCVAYRADLMIGGGIIAKVWAHLASSAAFRSLAELATSRGETAAVLCTTQGGVPMTALPSGAANVKAQQSATVSDTSPGGALSLAIGNRP
jgi:hypothetical protein